MRKLINWSELSRHMGYDRNLIRANKIPQKHKKTITKLLEYLKKWDTERQKEQPSK